jgi:hypothetical protein
MEQEFKVGDKVSWWGMQGVVSSTTPRYTTQYSIFVTFYNTYEEKFTDDGRFHADQEPSLVLIERPSEKAEANIRSLNLSLIKAAHRGDLEEVKLLIRSGADISFEHELAYRVAKCFEQDEVATFLHGLTDIGFRCIK